MFTEMVYEFVHAIYTYHGNTDSTKPCTCIKFFLTYDEVTAICGY